MHQQGLFAVTVLVAIGTIPMGFGEERVERTFSAKQVFDDKSEIMFESDFTRSGLDQWKISQDGRYRLAKNDPSRLQITKAPNTSAVIPPAPRGQTNVAKGTARHERRPGIAPPGNHKRCKCDLIPRTTFDLRFPINH